MEQEEQECYPIEILHHLNPHLIWIEVKQSAADHLKGSDNYYFEQIGLYGILPLQTNINVVDMRLETCKSRDWQPTVNDTISQVIEKASELWFSPAHVDRRSSIFDDNIHKYGEIIIKTKNGKLRKLSTILINTNFAYFDECAFLKELLNFNLKTKLNNSQMQKVIKALEKSYSKKEHPKNHWEQSVQRQTQVFHVAQEFENALTQSNVEHHNNVVNNLEKRDIEDILARKQKDFELCKDINEISVGRGKSTCPKLNKKYSLVAKKFQQEKQIQQYRALSPKNTFKSFLKNVDKLVEEDKIDGSMEEKDLSCGSSNSNRIVPSNVESQDIKTKIKYAMEENIDKGAVNQFSKSDNLEQEKIINCAINRGAANIKACKTNIIEEEDGIKNSENRSFEEDYACYNKKLSKKNRKTTSHQVPKFNVNTEKLIAFGPPDVDCAKLSLKVIPITYKGEPEECEVKKDEEHENNAETELKEDALAGLDSEVNFPISTQRYSKTTIQKHTSKNSSSALVKMLKFHKERQFKDYLSTSHTSQKDSSTDSIHTLSQDSDNETTLSGIIEKLNLKRESPYTTQTQQNELLVISSDKNHVNPFKNLDPSLSKFVEKVVTPVLMVHSVHNKRIQPQHNLRDVYFSSQIRVALTNMSVKHPMTLQTVSWSTILRGYSLFMVSPSGSGKTLGYTPAICRLVADYDTSEIPDSLGPICIVVCATAKSVVDVEKQCKRFLNQGKIVLACYPGVDERNVLTSLLNGCDVLVCTPSILVRLLSLTDFGIDMRRLSTCVLDDCERINEVYINEIKYLRLKIKETMKNRANKEHKIQFVVASRIWCDFMASLSKYAPKSTICINSFQECVLYSKAHLSVNFVKLETKLASVLEFTKSIDASKRTVIVCHLDEEVAEIVEFLEKYKYKLFVANHTMTVEKLYNLSSNWADYEEPVIGPILVCCDDNLTHLNITNAHYLMHYSMPSLFSMFSRRFSVLIDNYPSIFNEKRQEVKIKILLEETSTEQLPKILNFIKRCTGQVPESLEEISNKVIADKDLTKANNLVPICDNLLSFGECPDFWNCKERHTLFQNHDEPMEWVPKTGVITFRILHYHTAVTYSARLLSNIMNYKVNKYPQTYSNLSLKMGMYYSKEMNRQLHGIPKVGDVCGIAIKQNFYERCQVIKILNRYDKSGNPNYVLVKLIDEEKWERTRDIYLYHLPENFKNVNSYVVQIKVANIQPKDKDITFSDLAKYQIKNLIEKDEELYLRAKIVMTIGNTLIVDDLEACRSLDHLQQTVVIYKIKEQLFKNHAIDNPDHIKKLQKQIQKDCFITKQKGIEVSGEKQTVIELPKPRWAHLESDNLQLIYFASAENPDHFFIRLEKFEDSLQNLTKDIQKYILKGNIETKKSVQVNNIVLAKFPDDSFYYRAKIHKVVDDNKVICFFVDHGDWREVKNKDILDIPETFITRMPFQAIECRLVGIKPGGRTWAEFSTNWFCDQCVEAGSNTLKELYVRYFTKEIAESTGGHKYGIVMIDTSSDKDIIINKSMIEYNLAQENEEEVIYLDDLDFTRKVSIVDSEDDDLEILESYNDKQISKTICNNTNPVNLDHIFLKPPIRSVPLVTSDSSDDEWDFQFNNDDINQIVKKCDSDASLQEPKIINSKLPAILPNDLPKNFKATTTPCSKSSSQLSDFELVPSQNTIPQEIDSDDFTSPEQSGTEHNLSEIHIKNDHFSNFNELRKPKLCWRQNKTHVSFRIELIGVDKYDMEFRERSLKFRTTLHDTDYCFEIDLYGIIISEKCTHASKGLYILVKLAKLFHKNWLSLTKDGKVKKWIVYDPDSIDASSDEDDQKMSKQETDKNIIETIYYDDSDDDVEGEDDNMMDDLTVKANYT